MKQGLLHVDARGERTTATHGAKTASPRRLSIWNRTQTTSRRSASSRCIVLGTKPQGSALHELSPYRTSALAAGPPNEQVDSCRSATTSTVAPPSGRVVSGRVMVGSCTPDQPDNWLKHVRNVPRVVAREGSLWEEGKGCCVRARQTGSRGAENRTLVIWRIHCRWAQYWDGAANQLRYQVAVSTP